MYAVEHEEGGMTNEILYFPISSHVFLGHEGKHQEYVVVLGFGLTTIHGTKLQK